MTNSLRLLTTVLIVLGSIVHGFGANSEGSNARVASPALAEGQEARAWQAMQASLATQQTSIETFRSLQSSGSLSVQKSSTHKQYAALHKKPEQPVTVQATVPSDSETSTEPDFFSEVWPRTIPLSVPNVQVVDVGCDVMPMAEINQLARNASEKHGVDFDLLKSVMRQESAFKPCAQSVAGAMGLMQIMPDTADMLSLDDPFEPEKNVDAGAKFLRMMLDRYQGDVPMALGAYNAGPGRVDRAGGVPPIPETLQYVSRILRVLATTLPDERSRPEIGQIKLPSFPMFEPAELN